MIELEKEELIKIIAQQKAQIEALNERVKLLTDKLFGKKSEKRSAQEGPTLFNEVEVEAAKPTEEENTEEPKAEERV
jgi:hypothetical protein